MAKTGMNPEARRENIRALMVAAGLSENDAAERVDQAVVITWDKHNEASHALAQEVLPLISRTVNIYTDQLPAISAAELIIGREKPRTSGPYIYALLCADRLVLDKLPIFLAPSAPDTGLKILAAACYTTAAALYTAIGKGMANPPPTSYELCFSDFFDPQIDFSRSVDIDGAYLAGAGAIGNGFLWAARHADLRGQLHIVDDDDVSAGNLQRQVYFGEDDVGHSKAERLCLKAGLLNKRLLLTPAVCRLQKHQNKDRGSWLKKLIVAVDSRLARRNLQNEFPGEVFDASTTGSQEIVLHYNKQPNNYACLGCLYFRNEAEVSHEQAVADQLGISGPMAATERIDSDMARQIVSKHPQLDPSLIEGLALDTLYKQLCSSSQLKSTTGKRVVAPFAFVSVLAGLMLLLQVLIHSTGESQVPWNDWRISPWRPPVLERRRLRLPLEHCECCGRSHFRVINSTLWK